MRMDSLLQKKNTLLLSWKWQCYWIVLLLASVSSLQAATVISETMDAYRDDYVADIAPPIRNSYADNPAGMQGYKNDPNIDGDVSEGTMIVNYVGTYDINGLGLYGCQAGLKFILPVTSRTLASATLRLKVIQYNGSATATITRTDDNNWEETSDGSTSTFPRVTNSVALVTNQSVNSSGWNTFSLPVSDIQEKISSTTAETLSLIVTGSGTASNFFNFISDNNGGTDKAELVLVFKPEVQSVSVPTNGTYNVGDALNFTVAFDSAVTVTGSPTLSLTLNTGGTVSASLVSGSTTNNLVFRYTVASGNLDADGITVGSLSLNSGTIKSAGGNDASLTLNSVAATTSVLVDGVAPTISGVTGPSAGTYALGDTLWFTATASENVTVSGSPYIAVTVGSSGKQAVYASGSGSTTLKFRYVLAAGDYDADGVAAAGSVTLNSGTIQDAAGNAATLTFTSPTTTSVLVDGIAPTISGVTGPSAGTYALGDTLWFTATASENVTVSGSPYIAVTVGSSSKQAVYASGSGSTTLKFRYVLVAGDSDADGVAAASSVTLNSGTIQDAAGNDAALTFTTPTTTSVLVDGVAPTISGVTGPSAGTYALGDTLWFTATASENVTVSGSPYIAVTVGSSSKQAVYASGSGSTTLKFRYVLVAGDSDADGVAAASSVTLNGGTLQDAAGNDAALTFTTPTTASVLVDGVAPTISGVTGPSAGTYALGDTLWFTATASENVTVSGTPYITVTVGGSSKQAVYASGSGSTTLKFRYVLVAGDSDADGVAAASSVTLNGGTLQDAAGNAASLTFSAPTTSAVLVDATVPAITGVAGPSAGVYSEGDTLWFTVDFSEDVTVAGTPSIALTIGTGSEQAVYASGSGSNTLKFYYVLAAGDSDPDGIAVTGSIAAGSGVTIQDAVGNDATLTFTAPTTAGVIVADATTPTIASVDVPAAGTYAQGDSLWFKVAFSEAVTVTGTPYILLNLGGSYREAKYVEGSGTDGLIFRYVLASGDSDADGLAMDGSITIGSGASIVNGTGQAAILTYTAPATSGIVVDAKSPSITTITVPSVGTYQTGDTLKFHIGFSENVLVSGTPSLALTIGDKTRLATYVSGTGTNSLKFQYVLVAGDSDADGIDVASIIALGEGSITDNVGNSADLAFGAIDKREIIIVDTTIVAMLPGLGNVGYTIQYMPESGSFRVQMPLGANHADIVLLDAAGHYLAQQSLNRSADVRLTASVKWGHVLLRVNGKVKAAWSGPMTLR